MQPLAELTVIELATGIAGPYAGKLFADYGADVIKVEPPDGDPSRRESPRLGPRPGPGQSPLFAHLNTNKRAVVVDFDQPADLDLLERLLEGADVVIESATPGDAPAGYSPKEMRTRHPHLVVASVTPFGSTGPYATWAGGELIAYAMGGPLHATGAPDREPIRLAGNIVEYQCGAVAALSAFAAAEIAATSGRGVHVDVSNFETQAASIDRRMALLMGWIFMGEIGQRQGGHRVGIIPAGIYPTDDGYCQIVFAPNWMERVSELLDHPELSRRLAAPGWMDDLEIPDLMAEALFTWTIQRGKQQAMEEAQSRRLAIMPLNSTTDVLADPHFRHRNFWQQIEDPTLGTYEAPGPQFRMQDGWRHRLAAPSLGQHTDEVRADPPAAKLSAPESEQRLPLEGVRVLDISVVWAGPLCTALLGDLGAEVIRLDNPNLFPTATRGAIPRPRAGHERDVGQYWGVFPDGEAGERPWNRVGAFLIHARGKKGVTLDLRTELGRETFLRLVDEADVLVENNSAKVLAQLDLDWDTLHERNPRLIALRMPSLGLDGPYRDHIGFGAHMEAICGLTSLRGYLDLDPTILDPTYFMDPASGVAGAFATMAALRRRRHTGVGELIEFAQAENLLNYIGEYLIDASLTNTPHERHGNRHPHRAPQGVYPCAGDDRWITLSVADDREWEQLVQLMGRPSWAVESSLAGEDGRRAAHDQLDEHIAAWTLTWDRHDLAATCQSLGIGAAPVLDEADLLADPHLRERGFFRPNSSAEVPESLFPGHMWHWDGPALRWDPLNVMGADNDSVYRGLLGLSDEEMAALDAEGHLNLDYVDGQGNPL